MGTHHHVKRLQCYARGVEGNWEAICTDLDIAVQGASYDEVKTRLNEAIRTYVQDAVAERPAVAHALIERRAPLHVRAKYAIGFLLHTLRADGDDYRAGFDLPCPA